jgi:hypothetical protein
MHLPHAHMRNAAKQTVMRDVIYGIHVPKGHFRQMLIWIRLPYEIRADELITSVANRSNINLNGRWSAIVDPFDTGYYDYGYGKHKGQIPDRGKKKRAFYILRKYYSELEQK